MTSASLTYGNASADMLAGMTPLNLGEHIVKSEFLGAYISLGSDITVYYVARTTPDATVKFIMNGKETVVNGVATGNLDEYKFAFRGIAPQCIGDGIIAKLTVGDEVVETHSGYSVRANCIALLGDIDESNVTPLQALVCDLLEYGAAAQIYAGYKTDRLVNSGYENIGYTGWVIPDENEDKTVSDPLADAKFTAAGVYHGNTNKIYAKFWAEDVSAVTAKIDGEDAVIEQYVDGSYIVYTDDILVADFDRVYTITITTASGTQTITYSVDAWCKAKYESENTGTAALALALYAYGYSADQYIAYN